MNDEPKVQKAYVGDVEFNVADLANLTLILFDQLLAFASVLGPDAGQAMRSHLLAMADAESLNDKPGTSALLREAAGRIKPSERL